jgi:pyruvate carboxylase
VDDKSAAVETVTREKATSDPGSVGAPMSGVVVEVRVKEGHEVKRGDIISILSAMKVRTHKPDGDINRLITAFRWKVRYPPLCLGILSESSFTKVRCLSAH